MPVKRELLYPVFLECCQFADDTFWETIFEDLAYGKAPYGTYISKNFLCCSYKGKEFNYKLERKDPELLYNEIYKLLTEKLGILSYKEKAQKRLLFQELEKNIKQSRQEWSSIRRKNIKDTLLEKYVIDMTHQHKLTPQQSKYLLSIITLAMMFKAISSKDVVYKDDKILSIHGIKLEDNKGKTEIIVERPLFTSCETIEYEEGGQQKIMAENWDRFLASLRG